MKGCVIYVTMSSVEFVDCEAFGYVCRVVGRRFNSIKTLQFGDLSYEFAIRISDNTFSLVECCGVSSFINSSYGDESDAHTGGIQHVI
jgi:hypothetical protein